MTTWLRAIRVHQWPKNGLLLLPAVAAHMTPSRDDGLAILSAIASFCLLASAVYLLNDLVDVEHDRRHPVKRTRPIAAGKVGTRAVLVVMTSFLLVSLGLALVLPRWFLAAWTAYLVLTTAYSFALKRVVVLDVVVLAALYTVRVIAGAAAVTVELSRWFLAFGVFLFLSLALLKRMIELRGVADRDQVAASGRGWTTSDLPILVNLGMASAVAAALVYCLYITGGQVTALYSRPDLLWMGLPVLLYWLGRAWLLANRGEVHDDPVLFALQDRVSYGVLFLLLAVLYLAT